nr:hypothetical protein Iba_chr10fCG0020 [Ipomoea batatas]
MLDVSKRSPSRAQHTVLGGRVSRGLLRHWGLRTVDNLVSLWCFSVLVFSLSFGSTGGELRGWVSRALRMPLGPSWPGFGAPLGLPVFYRISSLQVPVILFGSVLCPHKDLPVCQRGSRSGVLRGSRGQGPGFVLGLMSRPSSVGARGRVLGAARGLLEFTQLEVPKVSVRVRGVSSLKVSCLGPGYRVLGFVSSVRRFFRDRVLRLSRVPRGPGSDGFELLGRALGLEFLKFPASWRSCLLATTRPFLVGSLGSDHGLTAREAFARANQCALRTLRGIRVEGLPAWSFGPCGSSGVIISVVSIRCRPVGIVKSRGAVCSYGFGWDSRKDVSMPD